MKKCITYVTEVKVFLNGKHVGIIRELGKNEFAYFPKGSKTSGNIYPTVLDCQLSLEGF